MSTGEDRVITKKGKVLTVTEFNAWVGKKRGKERADRIRLYSAIRDDYFKYRRDMEDTPARLEIVAKRGIDTATVNRALDYDKMPANAVVEFAAKAMVLQGREEQALVDEIETLDGLIADALEAPDDRQFILKIKGTSRGVDEEEKLPKYEYIIRLEKRKREAIRDTLDSMKIFKNQNTNINVVLTQEERDERMGKAMGRFGVEVDAEVVDE